MRHHCTRTGLGLAFGALLALATCGFSTIPAPEKLLPEDTLVLITAPDFAKLRAIWGKLPQKQLWSDPAMKPFRDNFVEKWNEELVKPLERELDIKWEDYTSLLQGQVTFAITQNGWPGSDQTPGWVLLLDTKDKSDQLKKNLVVLRKKWVESGKPLKTTKIRDFEFTVLPVSSNDLPKALRKIFPKSSEVHELGDENSAKPPAPKDELIFGQVESLLVISGSTETAEKVVGRMTGSGLPPLADVAAYQGDHAALFREAPLYGWVNLKTFIDVLMRRFAEKKENPEAPNPFELNPGKILGAIGLSGLKSVAWCFQESNEGSLLQMFLSVPESNRQGLFKILAGEPRESRPPPFVPADAMKFQRWRIDGQKTWETVQKVVTDISPQWLNGINFLLDTANLAAKEKDPGFDIKKNLIANLGDDVVRYQKLPRGKSLAELRSSPSLFLLGSPNAEALAAAVKSVLVYASQQPGSSPDEREFLGRKIYSVGLNPMMTPLGAGSGAGVAHSLVYAASGGYVAFSSDPAMVEEYLRSSDGPRNALRDTSGLTEAAQKVSGAGSSMFGYENQVETTRAMIEELRKNTGSTSSMPSGAAANLLPSGLNVASSVRNFKEMMDFSLLPSFDAIAKYFHFTVYGGGASVDGLWFKLFSPVPPGLKGGEAAQR
jgi:hypothetical protein